MDCAAGTAEPEVVGNGNSALLRLLDLWEWHLLGSFQLLSKRGSIWLGMFWANRHGKRVRGARAGDGAERKSGLPRSSRPG